MGVNLKELGLMLIIVIAIGAGLIIYFLNTQAKREGEAFVRNNNDAILNATSHNDNYKKKHTVAASIVEKMEGKSLGGVPVKFFTTGSVFMVYNIGGEEYVYSGSISKSLYNGAKIDKDNEYNSDDAIDGKRPGIYLGIFPKSTVPAPTSGSTNIGTGGLLASDVIYSKDGTQKIELPNSNVSPAQAGYVGEAFLVYGAFQKETNAKAFRDKFFPSANIFEDGDGLWYIAIESGF
jgi:hypothetical protein